MPVVIGAPRERGFDQPLGVLSDCHRRVEKFLAILEAIAATDPTRELDPGERASLCLALDYFRDSAPKHTADEEESLFPRLRVAGGGSALEGSRGIIARRRPVTRRSSASAACGWNPALSRHQNEPNSRLPCAPSPNCIGSTSPSKRTKYSLWHSGFSPRPSNSKSAAKWLPGVG